MQNKALLSLILVLVFVCVLIAICAVCGMTLWYSNWIEPAEPDQLSPQVGSLAPDFELLDIYGQAHKLSDFRGRPVMLNFWALWCGPCKAEMPLLQTRFTELYPDLVILAVEDGSEIYNVRRYVNEEELTFTFLLGNNQIQASYRIYAFPTSFFIDSQGIIQDIQIGSLSASSLDAALVKIGLGE